MQFRQVGDDAFQCMVTEEDFRSIGSTIVEVITDKDKLSALLSAVLIEAEHEIGYSAGNGVMAAFRPVTNGSVVLTVCACDEKGACAERLQEVSSIADTGFSDDSADICQHSSPNSCAEDELIFCFKSFKDLEGYAKAFPFDMAVSNTVYKDDSNDVYYLCFDTSGMDFEELGGICFFTCEYAGQCSGWNNFRRYCDEHFICLIESNALEKLAEFAV